MDRDNSNDRTTARVIAATVIIASIALLALAGLGGVSCAAGGENAGGRDGEVTWTAVSAAGMTNSINYQGRLTDSSGSPLTGTYGITFGLYNVSTGGTALAADTHAVDITDGLFGTGVDFDQSYYDGRALWLGVTVGADSEMTPRQELRPVPYALSLVPGAKISGSALVALHAESAHTSGRGIRGYATATSGANYGVYGASMSAEGAGVYALGKDGGADLILGGNANTAAGDNGKIHSDPAYASSDIVLVTNDCIRIDLDNDSNGEDADFEIYDKDDNLIFNVDESSGVYSHATATTGSNNHGVRAYSDNGSGVYGEGGKYGGFFTTNQGGSSWYERNAGVNVTTTYDYSEGVRASTTGYRSDGVRASTTGYDSDGVYASTTGYDSVGVYASTTGPHSVGVYAYTVGDYSEGVRARTHGVESEGVYAWTTGIASAGVLAYTVSDYSEGVRAYTIGDESHGVHISTSGDYSEGVRAYTIGDESHGVHVSTSGDESRGVYAETYGNGSEGVFAYSKKYYAIYADTGRSDHDYAFYTDDNIYVGGKIDVVGTVDPIIVECFGADPAVDYEIGDVVTLDEDSPCVKPCTEANDTKVVGVVGPTLDIEDGEISVVIMGYRGARPDEEHVNVLEMRLSDAEARMAEVDLRMSGAEAESVAEKKGMENEVAMLRSEIEEAKSVTRQVVKVKVDASHAPIKRGDLLTTSPTAGHAMKAQPVDLGGVEIHRPGTMIGKAMEPLDSGTGLIEVFVTLQ